LVLILEELKRVYRCRIDFKIFDCFVVELILIKRKIYSFYSKIIFYSLIYCSTHFYMDTNHFTFSLNFCYRKIKHKHKPRKIGSKIIMSIWCAEFPKIFLVYYVL